MPYSDLNCSCRVLEPFLKNQTEIVLHITTKFLNPITVAWIFLDSWVSAIRILTAFDSKVITLFIKFIFRLIKQMAVNASIHMFAAKTLADSNFGKNNQHC